MHLVLLVPCHHLSMPGAPFHLVEGGDFTTTTTTTSHLEILPIPLDSQCHTQVIHACVVCEFTRMCSSERKKKVTSDILLDYVNLANRQMMIFSPLSLH